MHSYYSSLARAVLLAALVYSGAPGDTVKPPVQAPVACQTPLDSSARFEALIQKAAQENGLDPLLIKAVISVESQFDARDISSAGACGLMQLLPTTARLLGVKDIFDPEQNIRAGAHHLRYLVKRFPDHLTWSLAAYNAGEGPVLAYKGIPPYPETQDYVRRVLKRYRTYRS